MYLQDFQSPIDHDCGIIRMSPSQRGDLKRSVRTEAADRSCLGDLVEVDCRSVGASKINSKTCLSKGKEATECLEFINEPSYHISPDAVRSDIKLRGGEDRAISSLNLNVGDLSAIVSASGRSNEVAYAREAVENEIGKVAKEIGTEQ